MWLTFVGIALYVPRVLLTGLCQLQGMLLFVFLTVTVVPSEFCLWPEGEEQRGEHRAVREVGCWSSHWQLGRSGARVPSPSSSCVTHPCSLCPALPSPCCCDFGNGKIEYHLPSKLVWLHLPNILLKAENLVLIKRQPALPYSVINIYTVPACQLEIRSVTVGKERQEFQRAWRLSFKLFSLRLHL